MISCTNEAPKDTPANIRLGKMQEIWTKNVFFRMRLIWLKRRLCKLVIPVRSFCFLVEHCGSKVDKVVFIAKTNHYVIMKKIGMNSGSASKLASIGTS